MPDFDYARRDVVRRSPRGTSFVASVPHGMPRVHPQTYDTVFYLYPDRQAAEEGEAAGGTGFLVSVQSDNVDGVLHDYAVTNRHVARDGDSVIRLNCHDGGVDILEYDPSEWYVHPNGDDVAVMPINLDPARHKARTIPQTMFVTQAEIDSGEFGVGDDAFMVGRFVLQDGGRTNVPVIGFGSLSIPLSMMPTERGPEQESFGVEMRSMRGYSGSPVFIVKSAWDPVNRHMVMGAPVTRLLGIDWGQITQHLEVREKIARTEAAALRPGEVLKQYVPMNTGMNGVVPIWKLLETTANETLAERRRQAEARAARRAGPSGIEFN